jgi:RNA polymerase subunit RPABC4/transcription elongation factor Spt4
MKECRFCKMSIPAGASHCPYCGKNQSFFTFSNMFWLWVAVVILLVAGSLLYDFIKGL